MEKPIIDFTPAAIDYIHKVMARRGGGIGFRLSVKQAGCTGYKYQPEIIDAVPQDAQSFTTKEGLQVFLDESAHLVKGTLVDLAHKGPGQSQLVFYNPNSESECGCGESFYVKQSESAES